jgi:hypothetical protein
MGIGHTYADPEAIQQEPEHLPSSECPGWLRTRVIVQETDNSPVMGMCSTLLI